VDEGEPFLNIAIANVKDEILKKKKIEDGLERIFFAGNTEFLIFCRMYLSPFMDIFMNRRDKLFGQIGMNACGKEFGTRLRAMCDQYGGTNTMYEFLHDQGWLDLDYDKYDKRLIVLMYGVYVLWCIAKQTPFYMDPNNAIELNRLESVLKGLQQFVVIVNNEVFLMDKRLPSGVFGTAWLNCLCELILEILQFYFCLYIYKHGEVPKSGDFVRDGAKIVKFSVAFRLINYGDDNLKHVSKPWRGVYTHENIMKFSEFIQMGMTPAQKEDKVICFKVITDAVFLKRTPVYIEEVDTVVGRLDFTSIVKMLAFTDSSESSWEVSVLRQAARELSFYPQDVFDRFQDIFGTSYDRLKMINEALEYVWRIEDDFVPVFHIESEPLDVEAAPGLTKLAEIIINAS